MGVLLDHLSSCLSPSSSLSLLNRCTMPGAHLCTHTNARVRVGSFEIAMKGRKALYTYPHLTAMAGAAKKGVPVRRQGRTAACSRAQFCSSYRERVCVCVWWGCLCVCGCLSLSLFVRVVVKATSLVSLSLSERPPFPLPLYPPLSPSIPILPQGHSLPLSLLCARFLCGCRDCRRCSTSRVPLFGVFPPP